MFTADDVNRMREENDVNGLILVLKSKSDPLIKWLAAKSLGDVGEPGDLTVKAALQNCLTGDPMVAAGASTALAQLKKQEMTGMVGVEKAILSPVKRWMVHRKLFLWGGVILLIGICIEMFWMIQLGDEFNPSIWTMLPLSIGPILGLTLFSLGLSGITKFSSEQITPLIEAVLKQNAEKVQSRIDSGDSIIETDATGQTALHWAAKYKSVTIVELLLEAGANVNAKDKNGTTPLQNAQKNAKPEIIETLGGVPTELIAQPQNK